MVCELPPRVLEAIKRYQTCYETETVTGEKRQRSSAYGHGEEECETTLRQDMKRSHTSEAGRGVHRRTFAFKGRGGEDCVVKVARSPDEGTEANRSEVDDYRQLKKKVRDNFVPILHSDPQGWWITEPEVETDGDALSEVRRNLRKVGAECQDLHDANVGYWKRKPVVIDWGFGVSGARCRLKRPIPIDVVRRRPPRRSPAQMTIPMFGRRR